MNITNIEAAKAAAYLNAEAEAFIAGKSFGEGHKAGILAIEAIDFAAKADADNAEYEFNRYCNAGPGVKASEVLAEMGEGAKNAAFWAAALYRAMGARAAWLAA